MLDNLGIDIVRLDLPFRLNHVNCFIAEGQNGHVVIDAGLHNETTVKRWEQELANKTVSDIYITHYHPDHFGYAGGLQQKLNATLSMSEIDAKNALTAWEDDFLDTLVTNYVLCGIPKDVADNMFENTADFYSLVTPYPTINHYFQEGEKVILGGYEYEIIFTPGHSDGLIVFYNEEKSTLLSTDHILPRITPNISYWFHGDPDPLATYLQSLKKIKQLDIDFVIPSHGEPFHNCSKRIGEIEAHHDERLNETLAVIKKHSDVYTICQALFNFKLTVHEIRFAIGETVAHIEYLRNKGLVTRENVNGVWHYSVV